MICHHELVLARENRTGKLARLKVRKCPVSCTEALGASPIWETTSIFKDLEICDLKIIQVIMKNIKVEKRKQIHMSLLKET